MNKLSPPFSDLIYLRFDVIGLVNSENAEVIAI